MTSLRPFAVVLWLVALLPRAVPQSLQPDIFINCGVASFFTDFQGNGWVGDEITKYFEGGTPGEVSAAIEGTFEDLIYQSERWDSDSDGVPMKYEIPVEPGSYEVVLHFSEVYLKGQFVGARVFNVSLEGEVPGEFDYIDIFAEAGGGFKALTKSATTTVMDGNLTIQFQRIEQNPKINAIEVRTIFVPSVLINCGGPSLVDNKGLVWSSDIYTGYFNAGIPNLISNYIEDTANELLYRTERWVPSSEDVDVLRYEIPILNGVYDIYLHWAETYRYAQKEGAREFDVFVQKELIFEALDIYKEVGGYTALVKFTTATVVNDMLTIEIKKRLQNPKLCAIEVQPQGRRSIPSIKSLESVFINAGSKTPYTDSKGIVWAPDDFFNIGNTISKPELKISRTSDSDLYASHRWDNDKSPELKYNIPAQGEYNVTLHFAGTRFLS